MHHQNCSVCSSLKHYERADQKSGEGTFLPPPVAKLTVLYNLRYESVDLGRNPPLRIPFSRLLQLLECPQCGTFYLYREDYEFLWGGSEDEQTLERLTDEQALACLEKLESTAPMPLSPPQSNTEENASKALEENKSYIIRKLEDALLSGDYEEMTEAMKKLEEEACYYPKLLPILNRIAGATFYKFDDNGAGGFPRPDVSLKFSFKEEALDAIEEIRKKPGQCDCQRFKSAVLARPPSSNYHR